MNAILRSTFVVTLISLCATSFAAKSSNTGAPGSIVLTPPDVTYFALKGDTLSEISQKYTLTSRNWPILGKRNHIGNDRTIPVGTAIHIPVELLPEDLSEAKVVALAGSATVSFANESESALQLGASVKEGAQITTSKNGFVTLVLSDDSRVSIPSSSQVRLSKLRVLRFVNSPRTEINLTQGRVESKVTPLESNKGRFEVRSPLAVAGVRGTHFRVGVSTQGIANEVLEGGVAVGTLAKPNSVVLPKGTGNIITEKSVGKAIQLLPPPVLSDGQQLQEKPTVQINGFSSAGATAYRAQITSDAAAQNVLMETVNPNNRFKFDGLPDGAYFVRVAAIDQNGLEGLPTIKALTLKARPEPPFALEPKGKLRSQQLHFTWTCSAQAFAYHLQVARDAGFQQIVADQAKLQGTQWLADGIAPGKYFWRIATITKINSKEDHGPFGEAQAFDYGAPLQLPAQVDNGDETLVIRWPGEVGQRFQIYIAEDNQFKNIFLSKETTQAELRLPRPSAGDYFIRVRATDADGYVGTYSATQKLNVFSRILSGDGKPVTSGDGLARPNF